MLRGTWDLPGQGLDPMSPALAGGFLITVPPGKSWVGCSEKAFIQTPKGALEKTESLDLMFLGCDAWNKCIIL